MRTDTFIKVVLLAIASFILSFLIVTLLHPIIAAVFWLILSLLVLSIVTGIPFLPIPLPRGPIVRSPLGLILGAIISLVISTVFVVFFYDLVKIIGIVVIAWIIFNILVKVYPEVEKL